MRCVCSVCLNLMYVGECVYVCVCVRVCVCARVCGVVWYACTGCMTVHNVWGCGVCVGGVECTEYVVWYACMVCVLCFDGVLSGVCE